MAYEQLYTVSLIQINAAVELAKKGIVRTFVMSGVQEKTSDSSAPRLSSRLGEELRKRFDKEKITNIEIICEADTLDSEDLKYGSLDSAGDVDFMTRLALKNGWNNILCIAYDNHVPRMELLYKRRSHAHIMHSEFDTFDDRLNVAFIPSSYMMLQKYDHFRKRLARSPFKQPKPKNPQYHLPTESEIFGVKEPVKTFIVWSRLDQDGEWMKRFTDKNRK